MATRSPVAAWTGNRRREAGLLFPSPRRDVAFPLAGAVVLFAAFVGAGLLYTLMVEGASAEKLITAMFIDAIMVIGIQIYVGNTGVFSFGHIGFGAVAGYAFAIFAIAPEDKYTRIPNAPWGLADVEMGPLPATAVALVITLIVAVIVGIGLGRSGA
ncbi:MAG: hypothetical protein F4071_02600, partial [Acidimicrobiaceae bacterium]|nr:hypothetical protein [Acidimicrobiaceae bacterium]